MKDTEIINSDIIQVDADVIRYLQDKIEDLECEVDNLKLARSLDKLATEASTTNSAGFWNLSAEILSGILIGCALCVVIQFALVQIVRVLNTSMTQVSRNV